MQIGVSIVCALKQACLGALILSLLARARQRAATLGRHSEEQPLQLLDATALAFEGGQVGLQLALENDLRVSFVLGSQGLANLRSALASLDDISRKPDPGAKPH